VKKLRELKRARELNPTTDEHYEVVIEGAFMSAAWVDSVTFLKPRNTPRVVGYRCSLYNPHLTRWSAWRCAKRKVDEDRRMRAGQPGKSERRRSTRRLSA
jgi:hypothetical protein